MFRKYQHLERFGTEEVLNIEIGTCYAFPKLDGTNASIWLEDNNQLKFGSRNRELSLEKDNAGFMRDNLSNQKIIDYLNAHPTHTLYGEWLVPHSVQTYKKEAWRNFYVFDVAVEKPKEIENGNSDENRYLHYLEYSPELDKFGILYITPLAILNNADYSTIIKVLDRNDYLIEDGKGTGEGIVLKNYDYRNKWGRQTWAKIVTSEFKEQHRKTMGAPVMGDAKPLEQEIVTKFVTEALVDKVYHKILNEDGIFGGKQIPKLLSLVYYDLVKEDSWNFINMKNKKNPTINFSALQHHCTNRIKEVKPSLF
jgi:hypothetical protein